MSSQIALAAILPHLPAEVRTSLLSGDLENACKALNLDKVEDPDNMRWLTAKRLEHAQGVSAQIVHGLRRKKDFLEKSLARDPGSSIWLGYYVYNHIREVFLVDVNRAAVLKISEPLGDGDPEELG